MTTKREHARKVLFELKVLRDAWHSLYLVGKTDEEQEYDIDRDTEHGALALAEFIHEIFDESVEKINSEISRAVREEGRTPREIYTYATTTLTEVGRLAAYRMFRIGQHVKDKLPFDELSPCACEILYDEDIEALLGIPFDLEGEGWVIKNFKSKKETE